MRNKGGATKIKSRFGFCRLCGSYKKLSFEHVPPESAFNNRPIINPDIKKMLLTRDRDIARLDQPRGPTQQRGAGGYTLCVRCNERTGKLYAPSYAYWVRQAASALVQTPGRSLVQIPFDIYPLRVAKQIACMFLSTNSLRFHQIQTELVHFVQDQHATGLPEHLRIYAYCTTSDRSRRAGVTGMSRLNRGYSRNFVFSEVAFPPFGYLLTIDCEPIDSRPLDISFFGKYAYNEKAILTLPLPWLPVYSIDPGDFRTRAEVHHNAQR